MKAPLYKDHSIATRAKGGWRRSWSFIAAATGATVGLGNFWKFAYLAGENGGAVFVLTYLLAVLLVAAPVLVAEVVIGSRGRANPVETMRGVALEAGASPLWQLIGWGSAVAGLLVLSYYSVVAGWGIAYVEKSLAGEFTAGSAQLAGDIFARLLADPVVLLKWQGIFLLAVFVISAIGIRRGLGWMMRVMVPLIFLLLIALVAYSSRVGDFDAALNFLFAVDFSQFSAQVLIKALGHAFFSLSIGVGAMLAFGAYVPDKRSITGMVATVAVMDTLVSLLAGLAIFPLVFSFNMAPSMGPGLMFVAMPYGFGNMIYGQYFSALFFAVVVIAALSSGLALIEAAIAWVSETLGWWRPLAAFVVTLTVGLLGLLTVLSFNRWESLTIAGMTLFTLIDTLVANFILPILGVAIAIFVGWKIRPEVLRDELYVESSHLFSLWYVVLRYIAAPGVLIVFASLLYELFVR